MYFDTPRRTNIECVPATATTSLENVVQTSVASETMQG